MPWIEALSDSQELRHCIRDLVALSTLPAIWQTYGPDQIAESLAAALVSMLDSEFVYIALPGGLDEQPIRVARTAHGIAPGAAEAIHEALSGLRPPQLLDAKTILNPLGNGSIRIVSVPVGFGSEAILVAGSRRSEFPTEVQRLLLGIAANDATIALQRWQAEREQRRFAELVESSSDFIAFASLDGVPQFINSAGLQLVGLSGMEEASRVHVLDFLMPGDQERARIDIWPRVMRDGRWIGEMGVRDFQTDAAIPFLAEWFRIDDPRTGRPTNIATVSRNLTARKRAEAELRDLNETLELRVRERTTELAEANQKLVVEMDEHKRTDARLQELQLELFHAGRLSTAGQLAAALAHELNQPLTAVTNSVNAARRLLANGERDRIDTAREVMEEAAAQTLRAGQIIRRLRDFVTRGETERQVESVAVMVTEASALALLGSESLGVNVRLRIDPKASKALANRVQVQQVLANLIRNALEAMAGEGTGRELVISTALLNNATIEIAVADSGSGIPKGAEEHLFEPFMSTKPHGMGLGLSICRSIVEAHGGRLRSEPNPGGGTIFHFTLAAVSDNAEYNAD
jgi:PAS domain S-box-containing protein